LKKHIAGTREMELKLHDIRISAVDKALKKAKQYRSLLEPEIAESICLDILNVDPENQAVLIVYILSLLDQIKRTENQLQIKSIERAIAKLTSKYKRYYYSGLLNEKRARHLVTQSMSHSFAYDYFIEALHFYQKAIKRCPKKNDEAILRWNSCIRTIEKEKLKPRRDSEDIMVDMES
jgi:tetratricopeptide (TPR) repeat protein